jgi:iron complex outermembrane receptor protein
LNLHSIRRIALGLASAWPAVLVALPAAAQQERPDSVVPIEPIVVRVLRSSLGSGSPYPVTVVAGRELRRANPGVFLEEALRALPGVQVQNRYNLASGERLAIRGFGARAQFGIRGVRVLVDGIPATLPDGQTAIDHLDLASLERVELLRGPGAALYGNAAGGVLHFQSSAPPPGGAQPDFRFAAGSDGLRTLVGNVSGTAGRIGLRAGVSRFTYDGFRRDPVSDDGSTYGGAARTVVNAALHAPLGRGRLRVVLNGLDMAAENPGSLSESLLAEGDRQAYRFNVLQGTREDILQGQAGVSWFGALGGIDAEFGTWGIRREFEGRIPPSVVGFDRNAGGARALLRGSRETSLGMLSLGAGIEVETQSDDRRNWENDGGAKGVLTLDQQERVRGTGLFTQARLAVGSRFELAAGLRYDRFRFEAEDRFLIDLTDDSGLRKMDALSPSVGALLSMGPRWELFGSVASSFQTPTTTELSNRPTGGGGFNPDLAPTRGLNVEGGVRGRVDSQWTLEATLFRTDLSEELVPFEVPSSPGRTYFRNAGDSHHVGWEVAVEGRPTHAAWLRVAYTRVDARFESYVVESVDFSGNRIPGLSPHRLDGRLLLTRGAAFLELRGLYEDAIPVDDANTFTSPAHFVGDVRAGLEDVGAMGVTLSPFVAVSNVFDRRYNASVVVNAFGSRFFEPGPGRTIQFGIRAVTGKTPGR